MGITIRKYFQIKNFEYTCGSTVPVYPDLGKASTGYEQRAGSRYASTKSAEIEVLSCMRGYHVYNDRWAATVGELLTCSREPTNASVRYAVGVIKEGTTIGHLPRKIFKACSVFLTSDGVISYKMTGSRRFWTICHKGDWKYHARINNNKISKEKNLCTRIIFQ